MKAYKSFLFFLSLLIVPLLAVEAQQKYALVIGNGEYTNIGRLNNPVNDANDMTAALQSLGFQVDTVLNGSLDQMENAVIRLKDRLSINTASYGFFFYAGHGVQSNGENYLIPADAVIASESFLRQRAVQMQAVLDELNQAGNALNIVVLDACRDNPFSWARGGSRGLQVVGSQPADSIIVYATGSGQVAQDGAGRNGLFTGQLLNNLKTPGLEVTEIFRRTGADVRQVSGGSQIPAIYSQFFGTAYLTETAPVNPQPASAPQTDPQPAPDRAYRIGDTGPAGGIVFYDKGTYSDGWRYLEAAPASAEFKAEWGLFETASDTSTGIGTGKKNTEIAAGRSGTAAQKCAALDTGDYRDWFLPSRDELDLMYKNLQAKGLGGFSNDWYWSSSEDFRSHAYFQSFSDGTQGGGYKLNPSSVRAVREF
jgi:hypothetical protein